MIDATRITHMASVFQESALLFAASDLGVFGALAKLQSADAEALAGELQIDRRAATLMMDACAAIGLLEKHGSESAIRRRR